jgi:transmembrane 9 superfamily member 2/4
MGGQCSDRIILLFPANARQTAAMVPGVMLWSLICLNFLLIASGSSAALPFGTILALLCMWLLLLFPLVFLGAWIASKRTISEYPQRTNIIPRQIPVQPWYLKTLPRYCDPFEVRLTMISILFGGGVPFFVSFIERLL